MASLDFPERGSRHQSDHSSGIRRHFFAQEVALAQASKRILLGAAATSTQVRNALGAAESCSDPRGRCWTPIVPLRMRVRRHPFLGNLRTTLICCLHQFPAERHPRYDGVPCLTSPLMLCYPRRGADYRRPGAPPPCQGNGFDARSACSYGKWRHGDRLPGGRTMVVTHREMRTSVVLIHHR